MAKDVLGAVEDGLSSVSGGKIIITPVAYPRLPPTPTPPKIFINGFFIVARSAL